MFIASLSKFGVNFPLCVRTLKFSVTLPPPGGSSRYYNIWKTFFDFFKAHIKMQLLVAITYHDSNFNFVILQRDIYDKGVKTSDSL